MFVGEKKIKTTCKKDKNYILELGGRQNHFMISRFLYFRSPNDIWIGLSIPIARRATDCCTYRWTDGTALHYSNWKVYNTDSEPNNQDVEFCIRLTTTDFTWKTTVCSKNYPFLCENAGKYNLYMRSVWYFEINLNQFKQKMLSNSPSEYILWKLKLRRLSECVWNPNINENFPSPTQD